MEKFEHFVRHLESTFLWMAIMLWLFNPDISEKELDARLLLSLVMGCALIAVLWAAMVRKFASPIFDRWRKGRRKITAIVISNKEGGVATIYYSDGTSEVSNNVGMSIVTGPSEELTIAVKQHGKWQKV